MNKLYAIFDMDGTLIDSMSYWKNLGREYISSKGITENMESILEEVYALTMTEASALFVEKYGLDDNPERIAGEMNAMMDDHYRKDIPLKSGVSDYLKDLKSKGVHMCVASATEEYLIKICLERLGVLQYFDFILSCESLSTSKREPKIYLHAADLFGAKPEEVTVYEDALYAVNTAKKAGFYVVAVKDEESAGQWEKICNIADENIAFK